MQSKTFSHGMTIGLKIAAVLLLAMGTRVVVAQTETILHNFADNGTDGFYSIYSGLVFDGAGNLYGTTTEGGTGTGCYGNNLGCGTVFELSPAAGGVWTETILHNFDFNGTDGTNPYGTLIFDAAGNLYGTTLGGGTGMCDGNNNCGGTVFELSPVAGGGWRERILYNFGSSSIDGYAPHAGLIFDGAGNLYGTTSRGGAHDMGTVFELARKAGGWKENVLHSFNNTNGAGPLAGLIMDSAGNLYGTASGGGPKYGGTVFELERLAGAWTGKVIHAFDWPDGYEPSSTLIMDAAGNLYGTTEVGGPAHHGTVFELTPSAGGKWTETVLHSFEKNGTDGYQPIGGVIFDAKGNLYGTTFVGGTGSLGSGTVFELMPASGGGWTETVLHNFQSSSTDGRWPESTLTLDAQGNLFGTSSNGGTSFSCGCGTVFEITP